MRRLIGFILLAVVLGGAYSTLTKTTPTEPAPPASPCATDWTKCTDNADMANNFRGWSHAKVACKMQANEQARYGTPEWEWFYFSSFRPGTDFSTGRVTLIDDRAKFQNGFGAMARARVVCEYDLRTKKVTSVDISPL